MTMKVAKRGSASQARGGTVRTLRIEKRDSTGWQSGMKCVDIENWVVPA